MSEELHELDRAIDRCRHILVHEIPEDTPSLLQIFHILCEELRHVELAHRKMHRLRTLGRLMMSLVMMDLEEREPQARRQLERELASVLDFDSFAPFNLHGLRLQCLPKERLDKGQVIALEVAEGVIELDRSVRKYLKGRGWADRGPRWPDYLNELTWLRDRELLDYLHLPEGPKQREELIAREVISIVEKDQESHGSKKLRDDLRYMNPPLTWGEVVYHFLRAPETTKGERGRVLREFLSLFRKRYCLECDTLFTGPKSSPRLTCQRCYNKLRKQKERASTQRARAPSRV